MDNKDIEVLLIEDNPHDAAHIISSLKNHNLTNKVIHIEDGEEALNYIFSSTKNGDATFPKLILLDLHLPKINGLEILERIRVSEQTKKLPVIILTASESDKDFIDAFKLGVTSYLSKPVNFESFLQAVSNTGLYCSLVEG